MVEERRHVVTDQQHADQSSAAAKLAAESVYELAVNDDQMHVAEPSPMEARAVSTPPTPTVKKDESDSSAESADE